MTRKTERSRRGLAPARPELLEARALLTMAATAPIPEVDVAAPGAAVTPINLDSYFKDSAPVANSYAVVNTTLGSIPVQLTPQATPKTVANFLNYAASGAYNNTIVHRSVPGFIWQTGGYQLTSGGQVSAIAQQAPVVNEPGQSNVRGTIAMAKLGGDPNSATDQFFFNESDSNASNLDNQNGGFTVFGHVVGSQGLAVMDAVGNVPVPSSSPLQSPLDEAPLLNYAGSGAVQPSNFVTISGVTTASEVFQATSDAPNTVAVSVQNDTLAVSPLAVGTAHVTVTGFGSDGQPVSSTFAVNVGGTTAPAPSSPTSTGTATPTPTSTPTPTPTSTPTPTPTTTSTPTATATPPMQSTTAGAPATTVAATPAPAPTPSTLTPTIRGNFPGSVTPGRATKAPLVVTLTNSGKTTVAQKERVTLGIYATQGTVRPIIPVVTVAKSVKLRAGAHTQVSLARLKVPAGTAPGPYAYVYTVTDPSGASTTVNTKFSLTVGNARG